MSASARLIVPSRYAAGKPGRQREDISVLGVARERQVPTNPFAWILRRRKSAAHRRYRGPVWKDTGQMPLVEAPGRALGKPHGSYIDDLVQLRKVVLLCWKCMPRFYYKRAHYYKDEVFPRYCGSCDACREHTEQGKAFFPEERLAEPGGRLRPGQVLTPA